MLTQVMICVSFIKYAFTYDDFLMVLSSNVIGLIQKCSVDVANNCVMTYKTSMKPGLYQNLITVNPLMFARH